MLRRVKLANRALADYRPFMSGVVEAELTHLAGHLAGRRILVISATDRGGGVSELLHAEIPLMSDLGLRVDWQTISEAPPEFFGVTKQIHNGLQGDEQGPTAADWQIYEDFNRQLADRLAVVGWDAIWVHDPQPLPIASMVRPDLRPRAKWFWRCHLDTSRPNPQVAKRIGSYLEFYQAAVYSLEAYQLIGPGLPTTIIAPAIDPLNPKNQPLPDELAGRTVSDFGIDVDRPLIVQVSRFDPWKDPLGVIEAWLKSKQELPELQLALIGDTASDDPQAAAIEAQVKAHDRDQPDLFVIADKADDRQVRAFLQVSAIVVQKSLREGFGLTVTEALWAGRPVIGGEVGGIPLQVKNGLDGYLVSSVQQCAEAITNLIKDPKEARRMGQAGQDLVRDQFLLPRLLRDDLKFLAEVLSPNL